MPDRPEALILCPCALPAMPFGGKKTTAHATWASWSSCGFRRSSRGRVAADLPFLWTRSRRSSTDGTRFASRENDEAHSGSGASTHLALSASSPTCSLRSYSGRQGTYTDRATAPSYPFEDPGRCFFVGTPNESRSDQGDRTTPLLHWLLAGDQARLLGNGANRQDSCDLPASRRCCERNDYLSGLRRAASGGRLREHLDENWGPKHAGEHLRDPDLWIGEKTFEVFLQRPFCGDTCRILGLAEDLEQADRWAGYIDSLLTRSAQVNIAAIATFG